MTSRDRPTVAVVPTGPEVIPAALVPERRGTVSLLSSVSRTGDWILPRSYRVMAVLASVELDLTRARVGAGTSVIEIMSIMGSVSIVVPPALRLECEGDPLLGSLEVKGDVRSTTSPDAPLVRIVGTAIMGSVEITVVDPDAPGWLARLKAKLSAGA